MGPAEERVVEGGGRRVGHGPAEEVATGSLRREGEDWRQVLEEKLRWIDEKESAAGKEAATLVPSVYGGMSRTNAEGDVRGAAAGQAPGRTALEIRLGSDNWLR
jgi:hypothetical protein